MSSQFIKSVAQKMKEEKIGVRDLARRCGLDASFISKMMQGKRNPPSDENTIKKMAEALSIDPTMLVIYAGRIPSCLQHILESPSLVKSLAKNTNFAAAKSRNIRPAAPAPSEISESRGKSEVSAQDLNVELL